MKLKFFCFFDIIGLLVEKCDFYLGGGDFRQQLLGDYRLVVVNYSLFGLEVVNYRER